jgi:hypothetical protein
VLAAPLGAGNIPHSACSRAEPLIVDHMSCCGTHCFLAQLFAAAGALTLHTNGDRFCHQFPVDVPLPCGGQWLTHGVDVQSQFAGGEPLTLDLFIVPRGAHGGCNFSCAGGGTTTTPSTSPTTGTLTNPRVVALTVPLELIVPLKTGKSISFSPWARPHSWCPGVLTGDNYESLLHAKRQSQICFQYVNFTFPAC